MSSGKGLVNDTVTNMATMTIMKVGKHMVLFNVKSSSGERAWLEIYVELG